MTLDVVRLSCCYGKNSERCQLSRALILLHLSPWLIAAAPGADPSLSPGVCCPKPGNLLSGTLSEFPLLCTPLHSPTETAWGRSPCPILIQATILTPFISTPHYSCHATPSEFPAHTAWGRFPPHIAVHNLDSPAQTYFGEIPLSHTPPCLSRIQASIGFCILPITAPRGKFFP